RVSPAEAVELAAALHRMGPKTVIVKLGDQGCLAYNDLGPRHVSAFPVDVKDSTAAGDTFNAALAVALAEGSPLEHALRFANAAAAISVTRPSAQAFEPSRTDVGTG